MDVRALRYFIAIYEEQSITAAAKRCFNSQPSISTALHQLEDTLETTLFVRHSKGVTPTEAGNYLYPMAKKLVQDANKLQEYFKQPPPPSPLILALMPSLGGDRISRLFKELTNRITGLEMSLVGMDEEVDARIVSETFQRDHEVFHPLWREKYVLAMPLGHALSHQSTVCVQDLNHVPLVSRIPCDVFETWRYMVEKQGVQLNVKVKVKIEEYALGLVASGVGVSIVPENYADVRDDIVVREFSDIDLHRNVGLVYNKSKAMSSALLECIRLCEERWPSNQYN